MAWSTDEMAIYSARNNTAHDYWLSNNNRCEFFGPVALTLSSQQSGKGTSERLHNPEKRIASIASKERSRLGASVKNAMAEIKMGAIRKRKIDEDRKLGSFWRPPKQVTVLGLMCEKMAERALTAQEKVEEREAAHALAFVTSAVVDMADEDENADEPIWQLTDGVDVSQEGEDQMEEEGDVVAALLQLAQWDSNF